MRRRLFRNPDDEVAGRIRQAGIVIAVVFAAIATWAGRFAMTHDGISYLDMSDAVLRRDWARTVNAHWSPLYPWLLALARFIVGPGPRWEFPTVHFVNLVLFLACLVSFDFFLRQLVRYRHAAQHAEAGVLQVPDWVVVTVGYVFFIWSSLNLIGLAFVAPDVAVATCVYLASRVAPADPAGCHTMVTVCLPGARPGGGLSGQGTDVSPRRCLPGPDPGADPTGCSDSSSTSPDGGGVDGFSAGGQRTRHRFSSDEGALDAR